MLARHDYIGKLERLEVRRGIAEALEVKEMLVGFGFVVEMERHCGFWLVHWKWPKLKLVGGREISGVKYL